MTTPSSPQTAGTPGGILPTRPSFCAVRRTEGGRQPAASAGLRRISLALLGFLVLGAGGAGAGTLFEDNFDNNSLTDSDEVPGFWDYNLPSQLVGEGGLSVDDGRLRFTIEATFNNRLIQYFSSDRRSAFDFQNNPVSLEVNDIAFDLPAEPEGLRIFPVGFTSGPVDSSTGLWNYGGDAAFLRIDPAAAGALGVWVSDGGEHTEVGSLAPPEGESLTDVVFSLDATDLEVAATFSDGSTADWAGAHGLSGPWGGAHLHLQYFQADGTSEDHKTTVSMGRLAILGDEPPPPPPPPAPTPVPDDVDWFLAGDFSDAVFRMGDSPFGVDKWEGRRAGDYQIIADPEDPENQVLEGELRSGPNSWIRKRLGAQSIADGETGTLFYRYMVRNSDPSHSIGLIVSDIDNPTTTSAAAGFHRLDGIGTEGVFMNSVRDGGSTIELHEGDVGVWYNLWMVFDNADKTYDIYIAPGDRMEATEEDRVGAGLAFNASAENQSLHMFYARLSGSRRDEPVLFDRISVDPAGENLSFPADPYPLPVPPPLQTQFDAPDYTAGTNLDGQNEWLLLDGFNPPIRVQSAGGSRPDSPSGGSQLVEMLSTFRDAVIGRPIVEERWPVWNGVVDTDYGERLTALPYSYRVETVATPGAADTVGTFGVDAGAGGRALVGFSGNSFVVAGAGDLETLPDATPSADAFYRFVVDLVPGEGALFHARVYDMEDNLLTSAENVAAGTIPTTAQPVYPRLHLGVDENPTSSYFYIDSVEVSWLEPEVPADPYSAWLSAHFTPEEQNDESISGPLADASGDGIVNLLAFVLAADPLQSNRGLLPLATGETFTVDGAEGRYLTLVITRTAELGDVSLEVQTADDPGAWEADAVLVEASPNGDGTVTEIWRDSVEQSEAYRRFMRLNVSRP